MITVHRRYYELINNLKKLHSINIDNVFNQKVKVYVVWANPEPKRFWIFNELIRDGLITNVLFRNKVENETEFLATTYPESLNISFGIDFLINNDICDNIVFQSSDVFGNIETYKLIYNKICEGYNSVLFHWDNGIKKKNVWHTNFFGLSLSNKDYFPPISLFDSHDVLEVQWGLKIENLGLKNFFKSNNSRGLRFSHIHETEGCNILYANSILEIKNSLNFSVYATRTWKQWIKSFIKREKYNV